MSKAALKKEFAGMTREQIIQIVLDAYAARKEVREYFDFFIDPDVDKLMEKTIARIDKELMRGKHGRSTSRITLVRRAIKDFASFDPGAEYVMRVMLETLRHILEREKYISFEKGTHKLVSDIIAYADAHAMVQNTMSSLHDMARDMQLGTASFRNRLLGRFMGIS